MDVGFYLGELLMRQGEVSVPGLGYFMLARMGAYYDESERKFYPPYHRAQFDIQPIDDDALAEYIAAKKNISVASAKYFCEKYINNLKFEAQTNEVPIGNLGKFYTELTRLTFKPAEKIIDDAILFGFEPVNINKADPQQVIEERPRVQFTAPATTVILPDVEERTEQTTPSPKPVPGTEPIPVTEPTPVAEPIPVLEPVFTPPVVEEQPEFIESEEYEEEYEKKRGPLRLILVVLAVLIILAAGILALYRYQPNTFAKIVFWNHNAGAADNAAKPKGKMLIADPVKLDTPKMDINGTITLKDSVAKPIAKTPLPAITPGTKIPAAAVKNEDAGIIAKFADATGTRRFEVLVAPNPPNLDAANATVKKLRSQGLDAKIVTDMPGPLKHITIGNFKTLLEATTYAEKISKAGKVTNDVYPQEINPQK